VKLEKFRYLAGIIAAHPDHKVVGRTRLQKTVKLLQRLGAPTDYDFMSYFYGPYSEGVHSDIRLLERLGLVRETAQNSRDGSEYFVITAEAAAALPELNRFQPFIDLMQGTDPVALELAATYDSFRERGSDHAEAMERLRLKKGPKCTVANEKAALRLLEHLGLPSAK